MSRLRANQLTNENANGAPNFPHGLTVTGIVTASTLNQTPTSIVVGSAVTANSQGIDVTGVVTATTVKVGSAISFTDGAVSATRFHGDGSNLTGIDATSIKNSSGKSIEPQCCFVSIPSNLSICMHSVPTTNLAVDPGAQRRQRGRIRCRSASPRRIGSPPARRAARCGTWMNNSQSPTT